MSDADFQLTENNQELLIRYTWMPFYILDLLRAHCNSLSFNLVDYLSSQTK